MKLELEKKSFVVFKQVTSSPEIPVQLSRESSDGANPQNHL